MAVSATASDVDNFKEVDYWLEQVKVEPSTAEAALMAKLEAARRVAPEQSDRGWLERLRHYQSKAMVPGEHGSEDLEALYPIANAAQGLINRLDRDLVRERAARLVDDPDRFVEALSTTKVQPRGFHDAAFAASAQQRLALRRAAAKRLGDQAVADLAGELALRDVPDAKLLQEAIATASPVAALHWLRRADAMVGSQAALALYQSAEVRPELRSAAQLHAAGSPHLDQAQRSRWLQLLADPRSGGSAAVALAKSMDGPLAAQLVAKARATSDPLERKRLLLALSQSALSKGGAVSALRGDAEFLAKLDEETRAWFVN